MLEIMSFLQDYQTSGFKAVINFRDDSRDEGDQPKQLVWFRTRRAQRDPSRFVYSSSSQINTPLELEDAPLSSSSRLRHLVFVSVRHPYARPTSGRNLGALSNTDSIIEDVGDTIQ